MHSLVSDQVGPICLSQVLSKFPIELSTVCGSSISIRQIATVKLSESVTLEGIVVRGLNIVNQTMKVPQQWSKYIPDWSMQPSDCGFTPIQILIGCDKSTLHPLDVIENGRPVETNSCCLKR